ncbi:uncharacterized protein LOC141857650 [Brevipalpus obovatus]|uniref:uncharacterized protein LOC141857650 n=1 Tax=Brevipalpus obovatus TaxID=246614 RepID=UPI003D9DF2F6
MCDNTPIVCDKCSRTFANKSNVSRHMRDVHHETIKENFMCTVCDAGQVSMKGYFEHLLDHGISVKIEEKEFETVDEFFSWKNNLERETTSSFIAASGDIVRGDTRHKYYTCCRSGSYTSQAEKRKSRSKGSKKIGSRCPAFLNLKTSQLDGTVKIEYSLSHVGHELELKHLNLPPADRERIAADLALHIPKQRVIEEVRETFEGDLQRIHLLKSQDLKNIERSYNLQGNIKRHSNDFQSLDLWIEELRASPENPVILYENPHDKQNFMLALMNNYQRYMLKAFGKNVVCIDSTHGCNAYKFQLTTLMTVDDNNHGVPLCFFISSSIATADFKKLFTVIKEHCGPITPTSFMSDDYPAYYAAWCSVMGPVENRLLCAWHVLNNWSKNLTKISNIDSRKMMMLDYQFKRIITQVMGETSNKVEMNAQRHQRGMNLEVTIAQISENSWAVPSSEGTDIYTVEKNHLLKCCSNFCDSCNICIHAYQCECPDNSSRMAICKHIHAVHNQASDESMDDHLMVVEPSVSEEQEILFASSQVGKRLYSLSTHEWIKRLKMTFDNIISIVQSSDEAKMVSLGLKRIQAQLKAKKKSSLNVSYSPKKFGRPGNVKKQRLNINKKRKISNQLSRSSTALLPATKQPINVSQVGTSQSVMKQDAYKKPTTLIEEVQSD